MKVSLNALLQTVDMQELFAPVTDLELRLPAYAAHRVRKLQAPQPLIQEIDSQVDAPRPRVSNKPFVFRSHSPMPPVWSFACSKEDLEFAGGYSQVMLCFTYFVSLQLSGRSSPAVSQLSPAAKSRSATPTSVSSSGEFHTKVCRDRCRKSERCVCFVGSVCSVLLREEEILDTACFQRSHVFCRCLVCCGVSCDLVRNSITADHAADPPDSARTQVHDPQRTTVATCGRNDPDRANPEWSAHPGSSFVRRSVGCERPDCHFEHQSSRERGSINDDEAQHDASVARIFCCDGWKTCDACVAGHPDSANRYRDCSSML